MTELEKWALEFVCSVDCDASTTLSDAFRAGARMMREKIVRIAFVKSECPGEVIDYITKCGEAEVKE